MDRRQLFKWGGALGATAGAGALGARWLLPPARSRALGGAREQAVRLFEALDEDERALACFPYDHPVRQYHNLGVWCGGLEVRPWTLARAKRQLVVDLFHAGLSEAGRGRVPHQFFVDLPGVHVLDVLFCGDPREEHWQALLSGPHLNLRLGGASREGVAFGGVQTYGDQRGDGRPGLPGNVYRFQLERGQRLFASLTPGQRERALCGEAPYEGQLQVQGPEGTFEGVPVAELAPGARETVRALIDDMLASYPTEDVEHARESIEANGGLDALHVAWYPHAELAPDDAPQVFRVEGPACVLHFRGWPHLHATLLATADGAPFSVGEELGVNPRPLAGERVRALYEAAMREATGAELAYYDPDDVCGRLRAGPIRSGDVFVLETRASRIAIVEVCGRDLAPSYRAELAARGIEPDPGRVYEVAVTRGLARGRVARSVGTVQRRRDAGLLRDATVDWLRAHGFDALSRPG